WLGKKAAGLMDKGPDVLVDQCPLGHGMWFDGGELQKVLSEMCTTSGKEVVCFLQEAFPAAYWQIAKK
ncbi:MAG: zf-TFIIB domain-containing protein, partial [Dehalococcoidia bacterium]